MVLSIKETYIYTPKSCGNDKLPASEQFRCEVIRATPEEAEELSTMEIARDFAKREVEAADNPKAVGTPAKTTLRFVRHQDTGRILRRHIGKCWNLTGEIVGENGKKTRRAINSGEEIAESKLIGAKDLIDELCAEVLRDKLPEETEKNSESASSSI